MFCAIMAPAHNKSFQAFSWQLACSRTSFLSRSCRILSHHNPNQQLAETGTVTSMGLATQHTFNEYSEASDVKPRIKMASATHNFDAL